MAIYHNLTKASPIAAVEFSPVSDGNFAFFYLDAPEYSQTIKEWLASPEVGQEILAETLLDGKPVLITQGEKSKGDMVKAMETRGDKLTLKQPDRKLTTWQWRGILSMTGHPMQLASGIMAKGGLDVGTAGFAILNLMANLTNIIFGAQKANDSHRLRYVKNTINEDLDEFVKPGEELPHIDEKRTQTHREPPPPQSILQRFNGFMQRNSVMLGEIGLRYLGGISLVTPVTQKSPLTGKQSMAHWKDGFSKLMRGEVKASYATIRNNDTFTRRAGMFWLAGKTLAFLSKTPDPYNNDKPHTWFDTFREKYVFRISTLTEMIGAGTLAFDRLKNRTIMWKGKSHRDYLGGVGGMLFMAAFAMRLFAPFGVRQIDMDELYAHATDTLALTPPDKLPQLLAETASHLKTQLKDQKVEFGELYTQMASDLYRYHHIAVNTQQPDALPTDGVIDDVKEILQAQSARIPAGDTKAHADRVEKRAPVAALAAAPKKLAERAPSPTLSHLESIASSSLDEAAIGMHARL